MAEITAPWTVARELETEIRVKWRDLCRLRRKRKAGGVLTEWITGQIKQTHLVLLTLLNIRRAGLQ